MEDDLGGGDGEDCCGGEWAMRSSILNDECNPAAGLLTAVTGGGMGEGKSGAGCGPFRIKLR